MANPPLLNNDAANPYQAPGADMSGSPVDAVKPSMQQLLLSFTGRVGRGTYWVLE